MFLPGSIATSSPSYSAAVTSVVESRGLLGDSYVVAMPRLRVQNYSVVCVSQSFLRGHIGGGLLPVNRCRLMEGRKAEIQLRGS